VKFSKMTLGRMTQSIFTQYDTQKQHLA
jgi:hypothetical protein